jgi:glycosyltransferase involved in cell wall biosynthesis
VLKRHSERQSNAHERPISEARVALLQLSIWPTRLSLLEHLASQLKNLKVFISKAREPDRLWQLNRGCLDVVVQKTITIPCRWRTSLGLSNKSYIHVPIDSYFHLCHFRPDVIISTELGFRTLMAVVYRVTHRDTRLIVRVFMSEKQQNGIRPIRKILRRNMLRFADAVIANGSSAKRYMIVLGYPRRNIFIIPTVSNLDPFLSIVSVPRVPGVRRLIYVGRLVEGKGLLQFLARLAQYTLTKPTPHVIFEIYGYGPLEAAIVELPRSPCLEVVYRGSLAPEDLPKAYSSADIFVFPTLCDEWGLVVNEALASGLPVLGSRNSQAVEDLIKDGCTGWIFDPSDPAETDDAIERALDSTDDTLRSMARQARQSAMFLSPELAAHAIIKVVKWVLGQTGLEGDSTDLHMKTT